MIAWHRVAALGGLGERTTGHRGCHGAWHPLVAPPWHLVWQVRGTRPWHPRAGRRLTRAPEPNIKINMCFALYPRAAVRARATHPSAGAWARHAHLETAILSSPVATHPRLTEPGGEFNDPDVQHLVCCDANIALCGLDVSDYEDIDEVDERAICLICDLIDENVWPCPVDGCPSG